MAGRTTSDGITLSRSWKVDALRLKLRRGDHLHRQRHALHILEPLLRGGGDDDLAVVAGRDDAELAGLLRRQGLGRRHLRGGERGDGQGEAAHRPRRHRNVHPIPLWCY
ncbi:hypothetical protein [Sphingomonas sp. CV7422]|uniref:hypothetical protein n=1 Tax=Sphingomonas sp. CV7422 TaxID=3018036 RepID=UPI0022FECE1B|nr:hypothetical protein [Sphingomonas sp. CV7422]